MGNAFFEELKQEIHRQTSQGKTAVLVGMHLCGNLSERAIELFHRIKAIKALVLCPCCLPKLRKKADATAFQTFVGKEQEPSYDPWCNFLKAKIEEGAAAPSSIFAFRKLHHGSYEGSCSFPTKVWKAVASAFFRSFGRQQGHNTSAFIALIR